MKKKLTIPAFKSEAEEAEWWYRNRARLDKDFVAAAKKGKLKRLDQITLKAVWRLQSHASSRSALLRKTSSWASAGNREGPALPDIHQVCLAPSAARKIASK